MNHHHPITSSTIDDTLQLSEIIPSTYNNPLHIETVTYPLTSKTLIEPYLLLFTLLTLLLFLSVSGLSESAWNYLNNTAKYLVEGGIQTTTISVPLTTTNNKPSRERQNQESEIFLQSQSQQQLPP